MLITGLLFSCVYNGSPPSHWRSCAVSTAHHQEAAGSLQARDIPPQMHHSCHYANSPARGPPVTVACGAETGPAPVPVGPRPHARQSRRSSRRQRGWSSGGNGRRVLQNARVAGRVERRQCRGPGGVQRGDERGGLPRGYRRGNAGQVGRSEAGQTPVIGRQDAVRHHVGQEVEVLPAQHVPAGVDVATERAGKQTDRSPRGRGSPAAEAHRRHAGRSG
jgi:hypothetical protein